MPQQTLKVKNYIVSKTEMVSTLTRFQKFLCKVFRIEERKGSVYTITISLSEWPKDFDPIYTVLKDDYGTEWLILNWNDKNKTLVIVNVMPIYGLNKKNIYNLKMV